MSDNASSDSAQSASTGRRGRRVGRAKKGAADSAPADPTAPKTPTAPADPKEPKEEALKWMPAVRGSFWGAFGLLIAILAAIGLFDDRLERLLRNAPEGFVASVGVAVVGIVVGLAAEFAPIFTRAKGRQLFAMIARWVATVFLAASILMTLGFGVQSIAMRDQPRLQLSATESNGVFTITTSAAASALRADEKMLLQLQAIYVLQPGLSVRDQCGRSTDTSTEDVHVAYWGESSPNVKGEATDEFTVDITKKPLYVCATSLLLLRAGEVKDRAVVHIIDISNFLGYVEETNADEELEEEPPAP